MDKNMLKLADMFYKYIEYGTCGGLGLDDKRPFGSSDILLDILTELAVAPEGEKIYYDSGEFAYQEYSERQLEYAKSLYNNLRKFLCDCWEEYKNGEFNKC